MGGTGLALAGTGLALAGRFGCRNGTSGSVLQLGRHESME